MTQYSKDRGEGDREVVSGENVWAKRFAAAVVIVVAMVAAAPLSQMALAAASPDGDTALGGAISLGGEPVIGSSIRAHDLVGDGDAEQALSRIEQFVDVENVVNAPEGFEDEVGFLPGARDVRVSGSVVGYVVDAPVPDVFGQLCALMESRNWHNVPIGEGYGATFMKESGTLVWALATCTQVGDATTVVFRL